MKRLANKVAVVTGGNSGIGFATAQEFMAEGARVVITGRNVAAVAEAVAQLGSPAVGVVSDAASMADLRELAGQVRAHYEQIDVLFVNAGVSLTAPMEQVDEVHFDTQFNINFKGAYFTIQQLLPLLRDGGSIVLNASAVTHQAFPSLSVYTATKAALASLAQTLSMELLPRGIRVNVVSPGPVNTPIMAKMLPAEYLEQARASFVEAVPMRRFGTPQEIAKVATFLASDDSSFIIGQELLASGGVGAL